MIRCIIGPGRVLLPDFAERLPGRGIWLSAEGDMIETARVRGRLARAAGRLSGGAVTVPDDLRERLVAGLERRVAELLGFARRAGQAVAGWAQVSAWQAAGGVGLLLVAEDAGALERARFPDAVTAGLSGGALGAVFGQGHVAHVAMRRGRLAGALASALARRAGLVMKDGVTDGVHDGRQ